MKLKYNLEISKGEIEKLGSLLYDYHRRLKDDLEKGIIKSEEEDIDGYTIIDVWEFFEIFEDK